jgi:ABC-type transport system, involved in lipoprotein release, permease component
MIKNMFKRAWLYITRKKGKSIVLILLMFVMANLVLSSISIKNAVNKSTKYAKDNLGSTVYLTPDMDKIREEAMQNMPSSDTGEPTRFRIVIPTIDLETVLKIGDNSYVKDFTYGMSARANGVNLTKISEDMFVGNNFGGNNQNSGQRINNGDFVINGINSYAFISEVKSGTLEIKNGSYFDETTDNSAIISYDLAEENALEIGDKITLVNMTTEESFEIEIIGIYDIADNNFNMDNIYMNVKTAYLFVNPEVFTKETLSVSNVEYFFNNPKDAENFVSEVNKNYPELQEKNFILNINSDDYEQMAGPIEQVGSFATTILWIVVIASILVISLIINNNIKDRKYEMGVLLSLGAHKINILMQFVLELVIVGTVGFVLSLGTSYFLASNMANNMLKNQIESIETAEDNNFNRPRMNGNMGQPNAISGNAIGTNNNQNVNVIDSIDVMINISNYIMLFLIGYCVIIIAMLIPSINVLKYEPKTILTGRK